MDEKQVHTYLGFLVEKYKMKYDYSVFVSYLGTNATLQTFTFYNENGCFLIHDVPVKGEVEFVYLSTIDYLSEYGRKPASVVKRVIDITSCEQETWRRKQKMGPFKKPFFWINNDAVLKVLAVVIEKQIEKNGQFYGIKIYD